MNEITTRAERRAERSQATALLCLVPSQLAEELLEPLRRQYADLGVEVMEEQRSRERRGSRERRKKDTGAPQGTGERRKIRNRGGRRVGERRATLLPVDPPAPLPRKARPYADRIAFYERVPLSAEASEDLDTARLITRIHAGDQDLFATLYERYFDRVYGYLRLVLRDHHDAEDVTQQVFIKALGAIGDYELRRQPFRAWLFVMARNAAVSHLRKTGRVEPEDPFEIGNHAELSEGAEESISATTWISDRDLLLFLERLPLAQRQVLVLRYMLDLDATEIAQILDRSAADVRTLQHRGLVFLRKRLAAIGRAPKRREIGSEWRRPITQVWTLRERRFALLR